jgi:hypothetical protein
LRLTAQQWWFPPALRAFASLRDTSLHRDLCSPAVHWLWFRPALRAFASLRDTSLHRNRRSPMALNGCAAA